MATARVDIGLVGQKVKLSVKGYLGFVNHAPKMLRDSMMLAYTSAMDDCMKILDACKVDDPVKHEERPNVVLLDENGHAT